MTVIFLLFGRGKFGADDSIEDSAAVFGIVMGKEFQTALVIEFGLRKFLGDIFGKIFD